MNNPDRLLDISIPGISDNVLLTELVGEDYLSSLFYFNATVMVDNGDLPQELLIGQTVSFRIGQMTGDYKIYNGVIYDVNTCELTVNGSQIMRLLICPQLRWLADDID